MISWNQANPYLFNILISPDFYKAFGGWDKNESAEDLIKNVKGSRTFNSLLAEYGNAG